MTYAFIIMVADEGTAQLESCLGFLRTVYPDAPAVVISDGFANPSYPVVCARHKVKYVEGKYLKRVECGGAWWKRLLEYGQAAMADWIIKLDADSRICRPFKTPPIYPIAGVIDHPGQADENVLGGCQAISSSATQKILSSGLLDHPALKDHCTYEPDERTRRHWAALSWMGSDMSLAWLARNLGISFGNWDEVGVNWLPPPPDNQSLRFAATHPHKLTPLPKFLEASLRVITTCKGRLEHLKQTLPRWLAEPGVQVTVVDYNCPEGTAAWVQANHPSVQVVHVTNAKNFHLARARNIGAAHAPEGWWCFWDADLLCAPGWADAVRKALKAKHYLLANPIEWEQFGSVVCHSWDYNQAGGYDELIRGWGAEDGDFYTRLRQTGIRPGSYPGNLTSSIPHSDAERTQFYDVKAKRDTQKLFEVYHRLKTEFMVTSGKLPTEDQRRDFLSHSYAETKTTPVPDPDSGPLNVVVLSNPVPVPVPKAEALLAAPVPVPHPCPPTLTLPRCRLLATLMSFLWEDFHFTLKDRRPHLDPRIKAE